GAEGVEDTLLDTDGVEEVMLMAGSGDGSDDDFSAMLGGSGGTATYIVNTDADVDQTKLQNRIRTELEGLDAPGEVTVMDSADTGGFVGWLGVEVRSDNGADATTATQHVRHVLRDAPNIS